MPLSTHDLQKQFFAYAKSRGLDFESFPLELEPHNFGGRHLEILSDDTFAIVGTDRGHETERRETNSIKQLFEWILELYT